jgi:hypothetical protein
MDGPPSLRSGAAVAAAVAVLAVSAVVAVVVGSVVQALFAVAGIAVLTGPRAVLPEGRPSVLPNPLIALLLALPPAVTWAGVPDPAPQVATYLAVGAFGLVATAELTALTDVRLPPRVAGPFVGAVTLAAAGAWTVLRWLSDRLLGTALATSVDALLWDFVAVVGVALGTSVVFAWVSHRRRPPDEGPTSSAEVPAHGETAFGEPTDRRERQLVHVVQVALVALVLGAAYWGRSDVVAHGLGSLVVTGIPAYVRRDTSVGLNPALSLLVALAALIHTVGIVGPYVNVPMYDSFAHAVSASAVALVAYAAVRSLDVHAKDVVIPEEFLVATVVVVAVAFGVVWETIEFGTNTVLGLLGIPPQLLIHGVGDIALDIVFDAVGALVVGFVGVHWWPTVIDGLGRVLPGARADENRQQ